MDIDLNQYTSIPRQRRDAVLRREIRARSNHHGIRSRLTWINVAAFIESVLPPASLILARVPASAVAT
jgi:hypothetical protein